MKKKPRMLIVDDEPDVRHVLARLFESAYEVVTAQNGAEGLRLAARAPINVAIVDAAMPGLSGFDVIKRLREAPATRDIPVLMLTALSDKMNQIEGYQSGADMYVTKPCDFEELRQRTRRLLVLGQRPYLPVSALPQELRT